MDTFSVEIGARDFDPAFHARRDLPAAAWQVDHLRWAEPGGPRLARLHAPLPAAGDLLSGLVDLLRRPVVVRSPAGEPVWWGFVRAARAVAGGVSLGWDLAGMANRVAVRYTERQPGYAWQMEERLTAFAEDAASVARFGRMERIFDLPAATPAEAEKARAALLARHARPSSVAQMTPGQQSGLYLEAAGWWDTLDWTLYHDPAGQAGYTSGGLVTLPVGASTASREFCQPFSVDEPWKAGEIWLPVAVDGHAADQLRVELVRWAGGAIAETLAAVDAPAAQLPTGREWVRFALPAAVPLASGVTYGVRVRRTGAYNAAAYYQAAGALTASFPHALCEWDGSAWIASTRADVMPFKVCGQAGTMEQAARLLSAGHGGQFLSGCKLPVVSAEAYRFHAGGRTALAVLQDLLAQGDGAGRPLNARVSAERRLVVTPRPKETEAACRVEPGGGVSERSGRPLPLSRDVTGQWALLGGGLGEQAVWIGAAEWRPQSGRVLEL
ncbi:MAG TPA: hypothetical protein VFF68_15055 [Anaerolineaceae bacterium]|nr:hypothetical protein [Anaerolineaceae bacterium]